MGEPYVNISAANTACLENSALLCGVRGHSYSNWKNRPLAAYVINSPAFNNKTPGCLHIKKGEK